MKRLSQTTLLLFLFAVSAYGIVIVDETGTNSAPSFAPSSVWNSTAGADIHIGNGWYLGAYHANTTQPGLRLETVWPATIGGDNRLIPSDLLLYEGTDLGAPVFDVGCTIPTPRDDTAGTSGDDLLFISDGPTRQSGGSVLTWDDSFNLSTSGAYDGMPEHQGFLRSGSGKRWGTNEVSFNNYFVLSPSAIPAGTPPPNLTVGFTTTFDNLPGEAEAQVEGGDSSGVVFLDGPNGWELAGIISGKSQNLTNQPSDATLFGATSSMSGIWYYRSEIESHIGFGLCATTAVPEPSPVLLFSLLALAFGCRRYLPRNA